MSDADKKLLDKVARTMEEEGMVRKGELVLAAFSGGPDSTRLKLSWGRDFALFRFPFLSGPKRAKLAPLGSFQK